MVNGEDGPGGWMTGDWGDELEDELSAAPTLWEAEVAALSDEQLAALEAGAEEL
jgi:hypothetical protein